MYRTWRIVAGISLVVAGLGYGGRNALAQGPALQYVPTISTYAGGGTSPFCTTATDAVGDGCLAIQADVDAPYISALDAQGNLFIANFENGATSSVYRVDVNTGVMTLYAGGPAPTLCSAATDAVGDGCPATQATLAQVKGLTVDNFGNVVITDTNSNYIRIVNKKTGIMTALVGNGSKISSPPLYGSSTKANVTGLFHPGAVLFDPAGNLYIENSTDDVIQVAVAINGVIDPANSDVYTLAGNGNDTGAKNPLGNGSTGIAVSFNNPHGMALDAKGNLYIADFANQSVRVISSPFVNGKLSLATAIVTAFAGNGTKGDTGDGGQAISAELTQPEDIHFDSAGNLLVAESSSRVRSINPFGVISTVVNTGTPGFAGDGGAALTGQLNIPMGVAIDPFGRMVLGDLNNHRMRLVANQELFLAQQPVNTTAAAQNLSFEFNAADTPAAATIAPNAEFAAGTFSGCSFNVAAAQGSFCSLPITFTPAGPGVRSATLALTDTAGSVFHAPLVGIGSAADISFLGSTITTVAGNGTAGNSATNVPAASSSINAPNAVVIDALGDVIFADAGGNVIRKVDTKGTMTILAGTGAGTYTGDGGAALSATLNAPQGVAVDAAGNLFIADTANHVIREVSADTGIITTVAGNGTAAFTGDTGLATAASLHSPSSVALDLAGNVYVADTGNHAVRRFFPGGIITTVAGDGTSGFSGDGGAAKAAALNAPSGVFVDSTNAIYIADTGNAVVRKVDPLGVIATVAGVAGSTLNGGDGASALSAGLIAPSSVTVDPAGDLYIASGTVVRFVSSALGTISTVVGSATTGSYSGEGGQATAAVLPSAVTSVALDAAGNLYLASAGASRIFEVASAVAPALNFTATNVGQSSATQGLTMANRGNQPLTITSILASSGFSYSSSAASACTPGSTLPVGATCVLTVGFSPTAQGAIAGALTITDNAPSASQTITLTGTGNPATAPLSITTTMLQLTSGSITYGGSVMATATITGGSAQTGTITFSVNGASVGTANASAGTATITLSGLNANSSPYSVTALYSGDSSNLSSSGSAQLTVNQATLTVTANDASRSFNTANPAFTYIISGYVPGDTVSVVSGVPALSTTATLSSPVGTYAIVPAIGSLAAANYNFAFANGTLTIQQPPSADFSIAAVPPSLTLTSGQVGTVVFNITPLYGYTGQVTLSCGTLPAGVQCYLPTSPVIVDSKGASVTLTLATDGYTHLSSAAPGNKIYPEVVFAAFPFISLAMYGLRRKRLPRLLLMLGIMSLSMFSLMGCGDMRAKAPSFTGNVTVTATDAGSNLTHAVNVALVVQ
jgi:hypothetical protein